jgi:hypothetical protein
VVVAVAVLVRGGWCAGAAGAGRGSRAPGSLLQGAWVAARSARRGRAGGAARDQAGRPHGQAGRRAGRAALRTLQVLVEDGQGDGELGGGQQGVGGEAVLDGHLLAGLDHLKVQLRGAGSGGRRCQLGMDGPAARRAGALAAARAARHGGAARLRRLRARRPPPGGSGAGRSAAVLRIGPAG